MWQQEKLEVASLFRSGLGGSSPLVVIRLHGWEQQHLLLKEKTIRMT